jgi:hypothetical protein
MCRLSILYDHERAQCPVVSIPDYQIAELVSPSLRQDERAFLPLSPEFEEDVKIILSDSYREFEGSTGPTHAAVMSTKKGLRRIQEIGLQILPLLQCFSQFVPP